MPRPATPSKRPQLTLAQLSTYDDILTDALIDHVYYWTTIPKNRPSYHPSRGVKEEELGKLIQTYLIVNPDIAAAEERLLATDGLRRFYDSLKTPKEKGDFRGHLRRYLSIYLPDCPFEVNATNRYTIVTQEASVTARRYIKPNETIKYLSGIQVVITPEEEAEMALRKKDFSIVVSSRRQCTSLFMGPARFANHDCDANARLVTSGQAGIEIIACKPIDVGDEITVTYGENYFGEDNCECLCRTCEENLTNGWKSEDGSSAVTRSIEEDLVGTPQGYSLRRRRRDESACGASSRTPSVTPDIRPRVPKRARSQKNPGDRASTAGSAAAPEKLGISDTALKRRRDALVTPPVTPAKRQKTTYYEVVPIAPQPASSRGSSSSEVDFGQSPVSSETGQGDAMLTDVTSPAEESPEPVIHSPKPTPIQRSIQILKEEDGADEIQVRSVPPTTPPFASPRPTQQPCSPAKSCTRSDSRAQDPTVLAAILPIQIPIASPVTKPASVESSRHDQVATTSPREKFTAPSADPLLTPPRPVQTKEETPVHAKRGRGRPRKTDTVPTKMAKPAAPIPRRRPAARASSPPPSQQQRPRVPGDYTLTPRLLSEPDTAWIHCMNCNTAFVQQNAYYTKSSCPRCERHSKLYGYVWPKTEPAGRGDDEERVLDHRMVHRFLGAEDEAKVRGRTYWKDRLDADRGVEEREMGVTKDKKKEPVDDAQLGLRRSGRARKASSRMVRV